MRDPTRQAERLLAIRLRYTINTHLEDRGVTTLAAIGAAAGLPAAEAVGLLNRRQWRAGDVAALQAVAARLGLEVVPPDRDLPRGCEEPVSSPGPCAVCLRLPPDRRGTLVRSGSISPLLAGVRCRPAMGFPARGAS